MGIRYKTLIEHYQKDFEGASAALAESFAAGELKPKEFDLGKLFAECFGYAEYVNCKEGKQLANDVFARHGRRVSEAEGAVSSNHFSNITGQIVYSATLQGYQSEEFVFSKLIPEVPTKLLDGEKMAGVTEIGDEIAIRQEGDPYTLAGVSENWVFTPPILDRGMIVPVTWEAVFSDRTGQLLERCGDVGKWMGLNKEKRAIDAVIDENTTKHRYNWRGTVIATYGDNSGSHTWDNLAASNGLVDHTDLDTAEQVFNGLVDPFTGEPIMIEPVHIVAVKALSLTVNRILNSTQILTHVGGYPTSGNPAGFAENNPYQNKYGYVTSRLLASRLATDTDWFIGDITKLVKYMVAEPMQTLQAPSNNHDEFHRRIVNQFRVNERGQHVVVEPRAMVRCTVA